MAKRTDPQRPIAAQPVESPLTWLGHSWRADPHAAIFEDGAGKRLQIGMRHPDLVTLLEMPTSTPECRDYLRGWVRALAGEGAFPSTADLPDDAFEMGRRCFDPRRTSVEAAHG